MNNTYIEQIVADAKAAIDKAVEMGVTDRDRVGVGGHSYGAFMTANLLAHCDLFKAGIAESGAPQPDADAFRVPERAPHAVAGAGRLPEECRPSCTPIKSRRRSC